MSFLPRCCFCGAILLSPFEVGSYHGRTGLHLAHRVCRDEFLMATRARIRAGNLIYSKPSATEIGAMGKSGSPRSGSTSTRRGPR
jgi:hypothetical protein